MNRNVLCAISKPVSNYSLPTIEVEATKTQDVQHSVFVPLHYEKKYSYPLVVWLHGSADDEAQLKKVMPHVSMRNFVSVAPCGTELIADERRTEGYLGYTWQQDSVGIATAYERVSSCIALAKSRFNVNPRRIFLAGCDDGGTMAVRLGLLYPQLFAGVASIGGALPQGLHPLIHVNRVRQLPIMLTHGRESLEYSLSMVCRDLRLLHSAGISVTVRQYPAEQEVTTPMLSDLNRWIMEIVTGQDSSTNSDSSYLPADRNN